MKKIYRQPKRNIKIFVFLIIFFCLMVQTNVYANDQDNRIKLNEKWEYHWGDAPTEGKNIPLLINGQDSKSGWTKLQDTKTSMINSEGNTNLWLKEKLPRGNWTSPCIYFESIYGVNFDIYLNGEKIYSKARTFNVSRTNKILIPIKKDDIGKELYVVVSFNKEQQQEGIAGDVFIGNYDDLMNMYVKKGFLDLVLGGVLIIGALIMLVCSIFLEGETKKNWVILSFIILASGLAMSTIRSDFCIIFPGLERYSDAIFGISLFSSFTLVTYYFKQIFGTGYKNIITILYKFQVIYYAFCLIIIFINNILNDRIDAIFNIFCIEIMSIIAIVVFLTLSLTAIYYSLKGNIEAKIFAFGFLIFTSSVIIDTTMLLFTQQLSLLMWKWGLLAFIISLTSIMGRRFAMNHTEVIAYSKDMEKKIENRTDSINNLLNNAGQGFLYFSEDLIVKPEYSSACIYIFGEKIAGNKISEIMSPNDEGKRSLLEKIFDSTFKEQDIFRRDMIFSLLPNEFFIRKKFIKVEYKIIEKNKDNHSIMMILTDITHSKSMQEQMEKERSILKMVVNIIANYDEFIKCVAAYRKLCKFGIDEILKDNTNFSIAFSSLYRNIHTFKGDFSQFGMGAIVGSLHEFETSLSNLNKKKEEHSLDSLKELVKINDLEQWLEEELNILKGILGEGFFNGSNTIVVENSKLIEIEKHMLSLLSPIEYKALLPYLKRLRYKSLKELLKVNTEYLQNLAQRLDKKVNCEYIEDEVIEVDSEKYHDFIKSLLQVFRNMIDHGIETIEERALNGKDVCGNIKCRVYSENNYNVISISDDGSGISTDILRAKIIEETLYTEEKIKNVSDDELINIIFEQGFSTTENITEISGRGVGLSVVKHELDELNGHIKINTEVGKGTEFKFFIPI